MKTCSEFLLNLRDAAKSFKLCMFTYICQAWDLSRQSTSSNIEVVTYCFSRSFVKCQGHPGHKIVFYPDCAFLDCDSFRFTDGYEMMCKAWSSIEQVSYCFSRWSIKFQGAKFWRAAPKNMWLNDREYFLNESPRSGVILCLQYVSASNDFCQASKPFVLNLRHMVQKRIGLWKSNGRAFRDLDPISQLWLRKICLSPR